jgi:hypothetical protein
MVSESWTNFLKLRILIILTENDEFWAEITKCLRKLRILEMRTEITNSEHAYWNYEFWKCLIKLRGVANTLYSLPNEVTEQ